MREKDKGFEWALFLIIVGLGLAHALSYRFYTIDDAAISFRFAEHLAHGYGLRFNIDQPASEGFTNFLWTLLQVPSFWWTGDPLIVSKIWGCFFALILQFWLWDLGQSCFRTRFLPLLPPALLAVHPSFAVWTVAGLETTLFAALLLGACLASYLADRERVERYFWYSALAFALLCLTRPEGLLFAGLMGLFWLPWVWNNGLHRGLLVWFAVLVLALLGFHLGRYLYYGSLIPNTFLVKGPSDAYTLTFAGKQMSLFLDRLAHRPLVIVCGLGLLLAAIGPWQKRSRQGMRPERRLAAYLFLSLGAYGFYLSRLAWDLEVGIGRYAMHVLPLVFFGAVWGVDSLMQINFCPSWSRWGRAERWSKGFLLLILFAGLGTLSVQHYQWGRQYYAGHNGVAYSIETVHRPIAEYFMREAQTGDRVITQDMGFIPFLAKHVSFIDTIGICDRSVAEELYRGRYNYYSAHLSYSDPERFRLIEATKARIRDYLRTQNARWILAFADVPEAESELAVKSKERLQDKVYDGYFDRYVQLNPYYHGLLSEPDILDLYTPVSIWSWSTRAYYVLYERKR